MQITRIGLISFILFLLGLIETYKSTETGISLDEYKNTVQILFDQNGLPAFYVSEVYTPVCNTNECLPIKINLKWDLDGEFYSYELPNNEILTKTDHVPFTGADYAQLTRILNDSLSILSEYTVESIENGQSTSEEVDGVTGATSTMTAGTFIPGALYSSVRLWHLTHDIKPQLKSYTQSEILSKYSIDSLVFNSKTPQSILALNRLIATSDSPEEILIKAIGLSNEKMTKKIVNSLINSKNHSLSIKSVLIDKFQTNDQNLKDMITNLWKTGTLDSKFLIQMLTESLKSVSYFNVTENLLREHGCFNEELYHKMIDFCEQEPNMNRRNKIKKLILKPNVKYPKRVKKRLKSIGYL